MKRDEHSSSSRSILMLKMTTFLLDISNTGISDFIPSWFWQFSDKVNLVNVSNNQIRGTVANSSWDPSFYYTEIDLSSNQLEGHVPLFLFNATVLLLSRNRFSSISSLCGVTGEKDLSILDISHNQLSGKLSNCWKPLKKLMVLNLGNNYELEGKIPTTFGYLTHLETLLLANKKFVGELPLYLKNLKELVVFDVEDNKLGGPIPKWIGDKLDNLTILSMRSNHFYGSIPSNLCHLQHLQVLDLSINHLSGSIPTCLINFTAMWQLVIKKGVAFWGVCGALFLNKTWRYAYFKFLNDLKDWIYVMAMLYKLLRTTTS